jgi:hypothetical protein
LQRWQRLFVWIGLAGVSNFLLAIIALHLTTLQQEPMHMSEYANSRFGLLWMLAVYSFTLGGAALSLALRPHLSRSLLQRVGVWMLWVAVLGAVLLAAFPMDREDVRSLSGTIHGDAALATFLLLGVAMVVLVPVFRATPSWRTFARASLLLGMLVSASCVAYLVSTLERFPFTALAQRFLVAFIATWFILLALRLLRMPAPASVAAHPMRKGTRSKGL